MKNSLSIINKQNKWRPGVWYATFAVDGIAFDEWLSGFVDKQPFDSDDINNVKDLVEAFDLYSSDETEMVWYFLGHLQAGDSKLVPVLVCPDDCDLSCIVIVAEQIVTENTVIWKRFGRCLGDVLQQNLDEVEWFETVADFKTIPRLAFDKKEFINIFAQLRKNTIEYHQKNGRNLTLTFPADHDKKPLLAKADWELEVDSWYE